MTGIRIQVGPYTVDSLYAGRFRLDGGSVFGLVPKKLWSKAWPYFDDENRIELSCSTLMLRGCGRVILIDSGCGGKLSAKMREIYDVQPAEPPLLGELAKKGVRREDVTDFIWTHLHFDHAGGTTFLDENGLAVPLFPRARHWVQKEHLAWARKPSERDAPSFFPADWEPVAACGQIQELAGPGEIAPGVEIRTAYGHTCAMQLTIVHGNQDDPVPGLVHAADLVPIRALVPLRYIGAFDNFPLTTVEEKPKLLKECAEKDWALFFGHDPYVSVARIHWTEKGPQLGETLL